jgi:peptide deformylase
VAVLPIITGADNPILRATAEKVPQVTKKVLKLIRDMKSSMKASNGVGLAAPQVGQSLRVCIARVAGKDAVLINPEITWKSDDKNLDEEGCLSLPDVWLPIPRHTEITVTYLDEKGQTQERKLEGFDARVTQHEIDHLDGILIVDYAVAMASIKNATHPRAI